MKLSRHRFLHLAAGAAALPAVSRIAWAQAYPARPVRIIVRFPAGATDDITARLIGQWLSERMGQNFLIDNRSAAAGNIATEAVVRAPADGYTLLLASPANAINTNLYQNLNFNFIRDIALSPASCVSPLSWLSIQRSGQDDSRIHCLCEGQSGQDQHGISRQRDPTPCRWRAVQDDDRRQHAPRAVSVGRLRWPTSSAGRCRFSLPGWPSRSSTSGPVSCAR
jgi:hypothetical protein